MIIEYNISVKTVAGWRSVTIRAKGEKISAGMFLVSKVETIDSESPSFGMSRTGAKRQQFNGRYFAALQLGAKKRLSTCTIIAI